MFQAPVSARGAAALDAQLDRLTGFATARSDLAAGEIGLALATTRANLPHRAVLLSDVDDTTEVAPAAVEEDEVPEGEELQGAAEA